MNALTGKQITGISSPEVGQPRTESWWMLDAEPAIVTGPWIPFDGFQDASIEVFGPFTGVTAKLYGTNQDSPGATVGEQIGSNITAAGFVSISGVPYRYVRMDITAISTGAVNAIIQKITR
jgi:hypothetical protein